jgi:hypothetical protein
MLRAVIYFLVTFVLSLSGAQENPPVDNISGPYQVRKNFHYANKTTISWGHNSETLWNVTVLLASTLATYDCSNTSSYVCLDPSWIYDWNKLWGKGRCGYFHDHHEDSDRFVWRRYLNKHILIQMLMFVICSHSQYIPDARIHRVPRTLRELNESSWRRTVTMGETFHTKTKGAS